MVLKNFSFFVTFALLNFVNFFYTFFELSTAATNITYKLSISYPNKRADSAVCVGADGILIEVLLLIELISFCSLKFAIDDGFVSKNKHVKIITKQKKHAI